MRKRLSGAPLSIIDLDADPVPDNAVQYTVPAMPQLNPERAIWRASLQPRTSNGKYELPLVFYGITDVQVGMALHHYGVPCEVEGQRLLVATGLVLALASIAAIPSIWRIPIALWRCAD